MSETEAKVRVTSSAEGMDGGLADAKRKMRAFEREEIRSAKAKARELERIRRKEERDALRARKEMLHAGRSLLGSVKQGVGIGIGMATAGGIASLTSEVLDFEKALTRLQIASDSSPQSMRALADEIRRVSDATGINRNEILESASTFVSLTGDMDTASRSVASFGKIAAATGTPMADIATSAAAMSQQLGIGSDQFEAVFSALGAAGKAGAIELSNMAGELSNILPQWIEFGNAKGIKGNVQSVRELSAALQVVRGGASSASETTTRLRALLTSFVRNADKFKSAGVNVFTKDPRTGVKTLRGVMDIVDQIGRSKLAKDPTLLTKALGSDESRAALIQLRERRDLVDDIIRASMDGQMIQRDFDTYMSSASGRFEMSMNRAKLAFADIMTPERIDQMVKGIERITGAMPGLFAAATRAMAPFSFMVRKIAEAKAALTGGNQYRPTDDEASLLDALRIERQGKRVYWSSGDRKRALEVERKASAYNAAIGDILESETEFGSTDESIRKAIIAARSDMGPNAATTQTGNAGRAYLEARRDEISVPRYKRIEREILEADPWTMRSGGGGPIDEKKLAAAFADALQRVGIKIGNEPVAKAAANSASRRTRPGGRP